MTELNLKTKVLFSQQQIQNRVRELGSELTAAYRGEKLTILSVLKGSMIFTSDLVRTMEGDLQIASVQVQSYQGSRSTGTFTVKSPIDLDLTDRHVLVLEDIIDTGLTYQFLQQHIRERFRPRSIKLCSLLSKPESHQVAVSIDYLGFAISKEFVIGYGLDYDQDYRHWPDIHQVLS